MIRWAALSASAATAVAVGAVTAGIRARGVRVRRRRRPGESGRGIRAVQGAWPDVLRDVVAVVRSGLPLEHALSQAADTAPDPLGRALRRLPILTEVMGPTDALESIRVDLADPVSDRVLEVLKVAVERGGGLSVSLLGDLADSVAADLALIEEIDAAALEHRINAGAVAVLPWLVLAALVWSDGPFRDFYTSLPGLAVVGLGIVSTGAGSWAIVRIGRIPEEDRVIRTRGSG